MAVILKPADSNKSIITLASPVDVSTLSLTNTNAQQEIEGNYRPGTGVFNWLKTNYQVNFNQMLSAIQFPTTTFTRFSYPVIPLYGKEGNSLKFYVEYRQLNDGIYQLSVGFDLDSADFPGVGFPTVPTHKFTFFRSADSTLLRSYANALNNGDLDFCLWAYPAEQDAVEHVGLICYGDSRYMTATPNPYLKVVSAEIQGEELFYDSIFSPIKPKTGPNSSPEGGWGDFDDTSDNIPLPGVPALSALASGVVNMYCPSSAQLQDLISALWSTDISQQFWKMMTNPMESLISLSIVPARPVIGDSDVNIIMGNVALQYNPPGTLVPDYVVAKPLTNQYLVYDCGSLNLNEYWGSALDYSPYTKCEIYLPYIGVKELDIGDVMGAELTLQYIIDFLTGTCTAQLECRKNQHITLDSVLYHWQGNMAMQIPVTSSNYSQLLTSLASTLVSAGLTVATGGSGAVVAAGVAGGALNMANAHPRIEKSGSIAMAAGAMDNQTPYIILTRPVQSKAEDYEGFKGWTANITAEIGTLTGYTEVEYVHTAIPGATQDERDEIERILKEGFVI